MLLQGRAHAPTATGASPQTRSPNLATTRNANTPPPHTHGADPLPPHLHLSGLTWLRSGALWELLAPTRLSLAAPRDCSGGTSSARGCSVQPRRGDTRGPEEGRLRTQTSTLHPLPPPPPQGPPPIEPRLTLRLRLLRFSLAAIGNAKSFSGARAFFWAPPLEPTKSLPPFPTRDSLSPPG